MSSPKPAELKKRYKPELANLQARVAQRLREHLDGSRMKLRELSEKCGASPAVISKVANGKGNAQLVTLVAIAAGLQIDVADLFAPNAPAFTPKGPGRPPQYAAYPEYPEPPPFPERPGETPPDRRSR